MRKMIFLAIITFCSFQMTAQQGNKPSMQVKNEIEVLKNADLNLSDIQILRITQVLMGEEQILTKNLRVLEGNKSLIAQRTKELKLNKVINIKGALTEQQAEKFDALKLADKF